jgi:hypothetical protein
MNKLTKHDKLFIKLFFFIFNILCVGVVIGYSTHLRVEIYFFTLLGCFGWLLLVMPLFFNHWGNWFIELYKIQHKKG